MQTKQPNSEYKVVSQPKPLQPFTPDWAIFRFLEEWTPEDLQIAVKKNIEVDFSGYMGTIENLLVQEITKKFETYRPDLQKVLTSKEGEKWVRWNIQNTMKKMTQK